jgi:hypothetical protein
METTWKVGRNLVTFGVSPVLGRKTLKVDGEVVVSELSWRRVREYELRVGGEPAILSVVARFPKPRCTLKVGGREIAPVRAPRWPWFFAAPCWAIPVLACGGAIPVAIGATGSLVVFNVAAREHLSLLRRVLICTGVVFAAWTAFVALVIAVALVQS